MIYFKYPTPMSETLAIRLNQYLDELPAEFRMEDGANLQAIHEALIVALIANLASLSAERDAFPLLAEGKMPDAETQVKASPLTQGALGAGAALGLKS